TAGPRTTLGVAELKSAPIDFVMLSPSLARSAKLGSRPAGVKRRFKINAASSTTSNASAASLMSGGLHASQAYLSLTHFCDFARASPRYDSVVALEAGNRSRACGLVAAAGNEHSCPRVDPRMSA